MTDLETLLAAKADADAALADAEMRLLDELAEAKNAHSNDPTPETKERHRAAAERVREYRRATRATRTELVAGDATADTTDTTDGADGSEG